MGTRPKSRWLVAFQWLLTAIYVLVVGLAVTATWLLFTVRYENTTQNKPFSVDDVGSASYSFQAFKALERQGLPTLASLGDDGMRVILSAYMNPYSYALAVRGKGDPVSGTLVLYKQGTPAPPAIIKHFTMARAEYKNLMEKIDLLAAPYLGDGVIWMCGSGITFERRRGTETISGRGDASNNAYYRPIANALYPLFRKVAAPDLEIYTNWASEPDRRPTGAGC